MSPLREVPVGLATRSEKQLAAEFGFPAEAKVLGLPPGVEICERGGHCFWRWLAHGALCGRSPTANVDKAGSNPALLETVAQLHAELEDTKKELLAVQAKHASAELELNDTRSTKTKLDCAQADNVELHMANGRLVKSVQGMQQEVGRLKEDKCRLEAEVLQARQHAENTERNFANARLTEESLVNRLKEAHTLLRAHSAENARMRDGLSKPPAKRGGSRTGKLSKKPSDPQLRAKPLFRSTR